MLNSLRAIVLRTTPYSDSSVVVRMFTDTLGMQSYVINGVRKPKARITSAMLQPLNLLSLEAYYKPSGGLQRVGELHVFPMHERLQSEPLHAMAAGLVAECFNRAIREEEAQEPLFHWFQQEIILLDQSENAGLAALALLTRLTSWLGFQPDASGYQPLSWLNLSEGIFEMRRDERSVYASPETARFCWVLLNRDAWNEGDTPAAPYLDDLMRMYQLHLPGFHLPRSLALCREMLF
ncbi:MAG: DNA repair protein RecO [Bacteroidia bacterium]|jgi:DNA repair protein RecO (recombination protein O)